MDHIFYTDDEIASVYNLCIQDGFAVIGLNHFQVIEADVLPSDLCTRREYARWLVAASGALSRYSHFNSVTARI